MKKDFNLFFAFERLLFLSHIDEHQEYVQLLVARLKAYVLALGNAELTALWNTFESYSLIEDLLYKQPKSAEETVEITELNATRTTILAYILTCIDNVVKRSPHAADVEKAKHLDHVSEPYKNATTKNIMGKTADIRNFVLDVLQEPNATYATDLHLMDTFLVMDATNKDLEEKYVVRAQLWLEKEKYGTLTQFHPVINEAMQQVADKIERLHLVNEELVQDDSVRAKLDAIIATWNAMTEQLERTLTQRGVTVSHSKTPPTYPTPPANPQPPSPPTPPPPFGE